MAFGLTIGTERAVVLQRSIQDELTRRGYSPDADPVMAEYITIMIINNKTSAQITSELEDLIGSDFDPSFTDWLFSEAAKGATDGGEPQQLEPSTSGGEAVPVRDIPPLHIPVEPSRRSNPPRSGVYQQALSQALPSAPAAPGQKRSSSARSPSPTHPHKTRRTDLPTGPRAMLRNEGPSSGPSTNSRSLIERVGGPAGPMRNGGGGGGPNDFVINDDIQSRIDNIVGNSPDQNMMMGGGGFPGMDMSAMAGMTNPLMIQDILMNQMALMAQMTNMMNTGAGQFMNPGFQMQGMPGDMSMYQNGMNNGFQGQMGGNMNMNGSGRGRSGPRGRGGPSKGRGGSTPALAVPTKTLESSSSMESSTSQPAPVVAPSPVPAASQTPVSIAPINATPNPQRIAYALPERPQSPTLCKFSTKCTNPHCRYAHPSPVATPESGVVLSNEACDKGKNCKDQDCIKSHVSPAVLNPQAAEHAPPAPPAPQPVAAHSTNVPCRFGAACTRPGCTFSHPQRSTSFTAATPCRFGAACTRAGCPYVHPEGRVLPSTFHRGLNTTGPMVSVPTPETGSMGSVTSPHRSVTFNKPNGSGAGVKEKLQQQMKEIEDRKNEAEKAVREAEAAGKKNDSNPVAIAA